MLKRGFTLIEVLVTLVILMFGLLGIAGLMAKGQRVAFEAFQRQQAVALADDMAERILANRMNLPGYLGTNYQGAAAYSSGAPVTLPLGTATVNYNDYLTGAISDCGAVSCDGPHLAVYDLALWDGLLNGSEEAQVGTGTRVGGLVNARGCIEDLGNNNNTCPSTQIYDFYTWSVRVAVAWQGNDSTLAPTASACGQGVYADDTKRRVVSLQITVLQPCTNNTRPPASSPLVP